MKNKKTLIAIMLVVLFGIIGGTIAYYSSQDTFTNVFNTGKYVIKTEETFESPDNWQPGETTPKKISVTNQGDVDAAVKVCFREKWENEDGNNLPLLFDGNYVAQLNYKYGFKNYWYKDCTSDKNCYYYYKKLAPGETTEDLLESVTFNEYVDFETTNTCTTDPVTHKTTCINSVNDYSGGKYTLYADIETVQYSQYEAYFGNIVAEQGNGVCSSPLNIKRSMPTAYQVLYTVSPTDYIKASEVDKYIVDPSKCKTVYMNTVEDDKKYYHECYYAYYIEGTYAPNQTLEIKPVPVIRTTCRSTQNYGDYEVCVTNNYYAANETILAYKKDEYSLDSDIEMFDNVTDEERNTWNNNGHFGIQLSINRNFYMPYHNVIIDIGIN